eukprot:scaffold4.g4808.t1
MALPLGELMGMPVQAGGSPELGLLEDSSCKKRLRYEVANVQDSPSPLRRADVACSPTLPPTPDWAEAALCTPALDPAWHFRVLRVAQEWMAMLAAAHPTLACSLAPGVALLATALYRQHLRTLVAERRAAKLPAGHDASMLAACLWVAVKYLGHRLAVPGASFMAAITGVPDNILLVQELRLMELIKWRVHALACECGALPHTVNADAPSPCDCQQEHPPASCTPHCGSGGGGIPVCNVVPLPPLAPMVQQAQLLHDHLQAAEGEEDDGTDSWLAQHFGGA